MWTLHGHYGLPARCFRRVARRGLYYALGGGRRVLNALSRNRIMIVAQIIAVMVIAVFMPFRSFLCNYPAASPGVALCIIMLFHHRVSTKRPIDPIPCGGLSKSRAGAALSGWAGACCRCRHEVLCQFPARLLPFPDHIYIIHQSA